jgi:hypothetical protein
MNPERKDFLNLHSKPGKFSAEEAGWYLGFTTHEIPMLTAAGLLKPLGEPAENGCKFFAASDLDKLKQDAAWLAKACNTVVKYWKNRNLQRTAKKAKAGRQPKRPGGAIGGAQGPKSPSPRARRAPKP